MDRKKILMTTTLSAFSISACGSVLKTEKEIFVGDCETTNDILGPFYREKAPKRSDLTFPNLIGTRIKVVGRVFNSGCITPLNNAIVEIWHCNSNGEYDNDSSEFRHRAVWNTNENGDFSFQTILPGKYLNGKLYRPAHIHFRVRAEEHMELVSQIYFKGDPHIIKDPWASQEKAKLRVLEISPVEIDGTLKVNFDIFLSKK
jgi:protocatechuate 3,4-dioxygenase beta subunit